MPNLTEILDAASRADKQAEQALTEWENSNFAELALGLVTELATEGKPSHLRSLAAIHLKNMLNAKDTQLQAAKHQRWKTLDAGARNAVKEPLLASFRSPEPKIAHYAAVAASEIAAVELPFNEWPQFLPTLLEYCSSGASTETIKIASIECLGFTAERASDLSDLTDAQDIPDPAIDSMLTAIVGGIQAGSAEPIRLAATTALRNALVFCNKNFDKKPERDAIMSAVCDATRSPDARVRTAAFDCLAQIAFLYYNHLQDYMTTVFELTVTAIKGDEEPVAKNAIEFWNTICDVEQERLDEAAEYAESGQQIPADRRCVEYAKAALGQLAPLLLETLTKQDEDADEDSYNLHMAGTVCLGLISQTVEDAIVAPIMPFVTQNIQSQDWRMRDAAIMAFQCILDGPATSTISPAVSQSIPALLQAISDPHPMVRDTTAHCISQICKLHVHSIPNEMFPQLLQQLMDKCGDPSAKVASQACSAIHNLASAFQDEATEFQQTNALSAYMNQLLQVLWKVCDREDSIESNLRVSAMEAIAILVQVSAADQKALLVQLLPAVMERLGHALNMQVTGKEDTENKEQLQGLLCALFQVLYQKLDKGDVGLVTDQVMTMLLTVLQAQNSSCHEEAFSAISAIADLLEEDFVKYMDALKPFLIAGLKSFASYRLCMVAVAAVGDICRAIEHRIQPYCDEIMTVLVDSLKDVSINRSVKPPVISCFGDIALAIGGAYEPYLQLSAMMLMQASNTQAPEDDEDLIEYVNVLRQAILEAYTGIVQGLKGGQKLQLFMPYVSSIVQFLQQLAGDPNRDDGVLKAAVALVGDIAQAMGTEAAVKSQIGQPFVGQMLQAASASPSEGTRELAIWALQVVQTVCASS
ncbi:Importin subunit beta-1 [Seminavis robusta]|uniref:Importin subunit beta-1 n=1 Tax=Seminavis robusta TaxID=568900 RepID=A0A9N8EV42_9STRA|nr:Importin subunit beta-1 [Seminavis robusta]|eukprot:Sro1968_g308410.1 Importin subunit beta-1 (870) ;mRNA; f:5856-8757